MRLSKKPRLTDGRWAAVSAGLLFVAAVVVVTRIGLDYDAQVAAAAGRETDVGRSLAIVATAAAVPGGVILLGAVLSGIPGLVARLFAVGVLLLLLLLFAFAGGLFFAPAAGLMALSALQLGLALLRNPRGSPPPPPLASNRVSGSS